MLLFLVPVFSIADTLKLGIFDARPFVWKEKDQYFGFHYDIGLSLAKQMGVTLEVKDAPILRVIDMLKKGDVELVFATDHKDLEALNPKKELVLNLVSYLFSHPDNPVNSKEEIKGPIGRLGNGCLALHGSPGIEWVEISSYEQATNLLKAKRIIGFCGTIAFKIIANKTDTEFAKKIKSIILNKKAIWAHALPTIDEKRWAKIQKSLRIIVKRGTIDKLLKKYIN
jgi:hypothetical protein